jgi:Protein kinase domain
VALTVDNFQTKAQNRSLASRLFGSNLQLSNSGRGLKAPNRFKNWVVNNYKEQILHQGNKIREDNRLVRASFLEALTTKYGARVGNIMKRQMRPNDLFGKPLRSRRVKALIQQAETLHAATRKNNSTIAESYVTDPLFKPLYNKIANDMKIGSRFDMTLQTLSSNEGEALRIGIMKAIRENGKGGKVRIEQARANDIASGIIRKKLLEKVALVQENDEFGTFLKKMSVKDLQELQTQPVLSESRGKTLNEVILRWHEVKARRENIDDITSELKERLETLRDNLKKSRVQIATQVNPQVESDNLQKLKDVSREMKNQGTEKNINDLNALEESIAGSYAKILGLESKLLQKRLEGFAESVEKRLNIGRDFTEAVDWNNRKENLKQIKEKLTAIPTSFKKDESIGNLKQYSEELPRKVERISDQLASLVPSPKFDSAMAGHLKQSLTGAFDEFTQRHKDDFTDSGQLATDFSNHLIKDRQNMVLKLKLSGAGNNIVKEFVNTRCQNFTSEEKEQFAQKIAQNIDLHSSYRSVDDKTIEKNSVQYKEIKALGSGNFATVYKYQRDDGSCFAVKKPDPRVSFDMMRQEAGIHCQAMGREGHKNIIGLEGIVKSATSTDLIMEYADGKDLSKVAQSLYKAEKKREITHTERIAISQYLLRGVMDGMIHCKKNGVLHLDLKPANVLYDKQSQQPKITDFGAGKIGLSVPHPQKATGTPFYISPETWGTGGYKGNKNTTEKADVWSLGIMIHELITNEFPAPLHDPGTSLAWQGVHRNDWKLEKYGRSGDSKTIRPPVTAFAKVVTRMLDPDPVNRPSLEELRQMPFFTDPMHDDEKVKELLTKVLK